MLIRRFHADQALSLAISAEYHRLMEFRIALASDDLDRFRGHSTLKAFKLGRPRNSIERSESQRLLYSTYELGGGAWNAEMEICHGEREGASVCLATFRLIDGPSAPLCALLQAMAETVPFSVNPDTSHPTKPVKAKTPQLHRAM